MGLQRYPIGDFRGGLNTHTNPSDLDNNEAQDLLNVDITDRGSLKSRGGKTQFDVSGFPANKRVDNMHAWYVNAARNLILSIDGSIYRSTAGGTLILLVAGTPGSVWDFESAVDSGNAPTLWAINGVDTPRQITSAFSVSNWTANPALPNGTMCLVWKNRMVVISGQRLHFSDIGDPESFPINNFVDIKATEDDRDEITWLDLVGDYLIIFKKRSTWRVYDGNTFGNARVGEQGCEDRFQSTRANNRVYFFNRRGLWSTTGVSAPRYESGPVEQYLLERINPAALDQVRVFSNGRRVYLAFPSSSEGNDRLLEQCLDLEKSIEGATDLDFAPWLAHDLPVSSATSFRPAATEVLIAGAANEAKLHHIFDPSTKNDDGIAIDSYWLTGWKGLITEEPIERLRRVNIVHSGHCQVEIFQDFVVAMVHSATVSAPEPVDPLWSGGTWEGGPWNAEVGTLTSRTRPEARGRYHAVRFRNNELNKGFAIYAAELALRGGKEIT